MSFIARRGPRRRHLVHVQPLPGGSRKTEPERKPQGRVPSVEVAFGLRLHGFGGLAVMVPARMGAWSAVRWNLVTSVEHWTLAGAERGLVTAKHYDSQPGFALPYAVPSRTRPPTRSAGGCCRSRSTPSRLGHEGNQRYGHGAPVVIELDGSPHQVMSDDSTAPAVRSSGRACVRRHEPPESPQRSAHGKPHARHNVRWRAPPQPALEQAR